MCSAECFSLENLEGRKLPPTVLPSHTSLALLRSDIRHIPYSELQCQPRRRLFFLFLHITPLYSIHSLASMHTPSADFCLHVSATMGLLASSLQLVT